MYRVGARECGFAILVRVSRMCTSSRVCVRGTGSRTSTIRSFARKVLFKVRAHCHWCVRVKCSGASDAVARDYKKDWKRDSKGLLYIFFVSRCVKCSVEMVHFICF